MRLISTSLPLLTFGLAALLGGSTTLRAGVIVTTAWTKGTDNGFTVSNDDLLQTNLSSIATTGSYSYFSPETPYVLVDGAFGDPGPSGVGFVAMEAGAAITFHLDLSANTSGYTLTQLDSYASWDAGRDGQEYTVSYSTASAPTVFLHLITIPKFDPGAGGASTKVSLTDDTGILAAHVAAVRYTFTEFENNGTAYWEIDAFGAAPSAAVPEPSTALLVCVGAAVSCAGVIRRRTRRPA